MTGVGVVHGRRCVVVANDATVKGGTYYPMTVKKHLRAQEVALHNELPCIYLVDSGGAFLPMQDEVFPDREHFGRIFFNQATMSKLAIPQIACVMGSCTAGGAYVPAMSDETVIVRGQGTIFLGGPPLVKAATGEEVTAEELGGGELHARVSGVVDHLAEDDEHALEILRSIVATLPAARTAPWPRRESAAAARGPRGRCSTSCPSTRARPTTRATCCAAWSTRPSCTSSRSSTARRSSAPSPTSTATRSASSPTTASSSASPRSRARTSSSSATGAASRCCSCRTSPGSWSAATTRRAASRRTAPSSSPRSRRARVPKLTVVTGGSYGAGNYGMCGRAYSPRFLFMWPNARIGVMGGEQAAMVMAEVGRPDEGARLRELYEHQGRPVYATARIWDDGVIDPRATRDVLANALAACAQAPLGQLGYGIFRM